jgi:hypothetical protein
VGEITIARFFPDTRKEGRKEGQTRKQAYKNVVKKEAAAAAAE